MATFADGTLGEVPLGLIRRLAMDLRQRVSVLRAAARRTRRRDDAEAIHDLRVAARRLGAACALWPFLRDDRRAARAEKAIAALRRRIGPTRESEVLFDQLCRRVETAPPAVRVTLSGLLRRLERRVERGRDESAARLRRPRIRRAMRGLAPRLERLVQELAVRPGGIEGALAEAGARLALRRRDALAALEAARAERTDALLHAARIALKKWRYAEECAAAADPSLRGADPAALRHAQEALGAIHDAAVLRDTLAREAERLERADVATAGVRELAAQIEEGRRERVAAFAAKPRLSA